MKKIILVFLWLLPIPHLDLWSGIEKLINITCGLEEGDFEAELRMQTLTAQEVTDLFFHSILSRKTKPLHVLLKSDYKIFINKFGIYHPGGDSRPRWTNPLFLAIQEANFARASYLIDHGANVNFLLGKMNPDGSYIQNYENPLNVVLKTRLMSKEDFWNFTHLINTLFLSLESPNSPNANSMTPLHQLMVFAFSENNKYFSEEFYITFAQRLLRKSSKEEVTAMLAQPFWIEEGSERLIEIKNIADLIKWVFEKEYNHVQEEALPLHSEDGSLISNAEVLYFYAKQSEKLKGLYKGLAISKNVANKVLRPYCVAPGTEHVLYDIAKYVNLKSPSRH